MRGMFWAWDTTWLSSIPRWQAPHGLLVSRWRRASPGEDKYDLWSIAEAMNLATLPILRCNSWLKCATAVGECGGMADVCSWQPAQTCSRGSRLSEAFVLVATAAWQVGQPGTICRWSRCENGAAAATAAPSDKRRGPSLCRRSAKLFSRHRPSTGCCHREAAGTRLDVPKLLSCPCQGSSRRETHESRRRAFRS